MSTDAQRRPKSLEFVPRQLLREDVGNHLLGGAVLQVHLR